jgi:hypothetical protein
MALDRFERSPSKTLAEQIINVGLLKVDVLLLGKTKKLDDET